MFGFHCKAIGKIVTSDHCEKMRKLGNLRPIEPCSKCEDWKIYFSKALESENLVVPDNVGDSVAVIAEKETVVAEKETPISPPTKAKAKRSSTRSLKKTHYKLNRKCRCGRPIADWNKGDLCSHCKKRLRIYSAKQGKICKGDGCGALLSDKNITGYCRSCTVKNRVVAMWKGSSNVRTLQHEKMEVLKENTALQKERERIKGVVKDCMDKLAGLLDAL